MDEMVEIQRLRGVKYAGVREIAETWEWELDELFDYLRDGGTRTEYKNASAMQCAHEIIRFLVEKI